MKYEEAITMLTKMRDRLLNPPNPNAVIYNFKYLREIMKDLTVNDNINEKKVIDVLKTFLEYDNTEKPTKEKSLTYDSINKKVN